MSVDNKDDIEMIMNMIDRKMTEGTSRLSVGFDGENTSGEAKELHHHGRCDVGSPWAKGTVSNCDAVDTDI